MKKKNVFVTTILVICSFLLGVWTTNTFGSSKKEYDERVNVFLEIYDTLKENWYYGDEETLDKVMESVYSSIYDYNVDPYTYFTAAPIEGVEEEKTYGIGIVAALNYDLEQVNYSNPVLNELGILVIKTYENSPSYNAGLKVLDYIVGVYENNKYLPFEGMNYLDIRQYLVGKLDSKSTYKVKRNEEFIDVEITRNAYKLQTATLNNSYKEIYPNSEVLEIEEFAESTGNEVSNLLKTIKNTKEKDLVIDLRDNPGGYVYSMANVASCFLKAGLPVLTYEDKDGNKYTAEKTNGKTIYEFNSITVLINGNSASASEALTLCLDYYQEYLNAFQIVGTTSYGKGIAQTTINLSNGASLKYTFAKVYDPGGEESIHQKGITPDIEIPLEKYTNGDALSYYTSKYNQLKEAVRLGVILGE